MALTDSLTLQQAVNQFITLFVVLDPAATIPMYLLTVQGLGKAQARQVAFYATAVAFAVLLFFIVFFELLLEAMNIPLYSFQLAGSLVLLIYGLRLVFEQMKPDAGGDASTSEGLLARAIFPLTIPGLAGPGTMMTVVLLTQNASNSYLQQAQTSGILALCLVLVFATFLAAGFISKLLGAGGLNIVSRVMGLILASIALTNGVTAIKQIFHLP